MLRTKFHFAIILSLFLVMLSVQLMAASFFDDFGELPDNSWEGIPNTASINIIAGQIQTNTLLLSEATDSARLTSVDMFRYGTYTIKFKLNNSADDSMVYLGFMSRVPWGANGCSVMMQGHKFTLQIREDSGEVAQPFLSPVITQNVWHTLVLDWKPDSVEMLFDGNSCGKFTDQSKIPDAYIPMIIDFVSGGTKIGLEIDSVQVTGTEDIKVGKRTDVFIPLPPIRTPPDTKNVKWPERISPELKMLENGVTAKNAFYTFTLDWKTGLKLSELFNNVTGVSCLVDGKSSELFMLAANNKLIRTSDMVVKGSKISTYKNGKSISVDVVDLSGNYQGRLYFTFDLSPEIKIKFDIKNAAEEQKVAIYWPYLTSLQIGDNTKDNFFLFPWKGGWTENQSVELGVSYGQSAGFFQMFGVFNPSLGSSVYTYLKDQSGQIKSGFLKKMEDIDTPVHSYVPLYPENQPEKGAISDLPGTQVTFRFLPVNLKSGQTKELPEAVIAVSPGDWHTAFESYSKWAHTWLKKPVVPDWYKGIFQSLAVHDEAGNSGFEHGFLKNDQWALAEQATSDEQLLEIVCWWNHLYSDSAGTSRPGKRGWFKGTTGIYDYWDELGGLDRLRGEITGAHKKGVRVNLYSTPSFVWTFSDVAKQHQDWVIKNPDGNVSHDWSAVAGDIHYNFDDMCYSVSGWRDYISNAVGKMIKDTGADGIFMDTMNHHKFCYNPVHNHPENFSEAVEAMLKKIRGSVKSANSQAVMTAEDVCAEKFIQYLDGCLIKTFDPSAPEYPKYDLYTVHFVRFYFPEIKYQEWGSSFETGARRAFFNGIAYMRGDISDKKDPFTGRLISAQEQIKYLGMTSGIMRENADAFAGLNPEPIVPTLVSKLYANKFPGKGQTIWTFYNRTGQNIDADLIEIQNVPGSVYIDLVTGKTLDTRVVGDKVIIKMSLGNGEVTAIAQRTKNWKPTKAF